jgi:hypothetical protein
MKPTDLYARLELLPPYTEPAASSPTGRWTQLWQRVQGSWQRVGQDLWRYFCGSQEPRITRQCDRTGHVYFKVYDPVDRQHYEFGSEQELRIWLEQRYYQ